MPYSSRAKRRWKRAYKLVKKQNAKKLVTVREMHRYVNRGREKKFYTVNYTALTVPNDWTGFPLCLTAVPQATDVQSDSYRDGDMITPKYLELRWGVKAHATASTGTNVRFIVFRYKAMSNADPHPVQGDILQTPTTYPLTSIYEHDNKKNFDILYDKVIAMPTDTSAGKTYYPQKTLRFGQKVMNKNIHFSAGTVYGQNHVYIMAYGNQDTYEPLIFMSSNFEFTDS